MVIQMIEVEHLYKRYGNILAVDDVSFTVNDGEILGFLGPNGAGKSTTMNIITGYLSSTSGTVKIDGYDILENPDQAKKRIGYLPEHPPLYLEMTVKEYLNFIFDLKKVRFPRKPHIEEICRLVRIENVYNRLIRNLSKGYRQRVGIAQALIGNPDVLILDEPTVGLDPQQIIEIRNLIKQLGKNHTVILSSHILSEVQAVCERVIIIAKGRIIADDTPENLSRNLSTDHSLTARIAGPRADVANLLKTVPGVKAVTCLGAREKGVFEYIIEPFENARDIRPIIFERLAQRHWPLLMFKSNELTLEQIFLRLMDNAENNKQLFKPVNETKSEALSGQAAESDESAEKSQEEALSLSTDNQEPDSGQTLKDKEEV